MKHSLSCLLLICALAAPAFAQRTVVSGTVTDAQGLAYIGGSLSVTLSLPVGVSGAILNGAQVQGTVGPVQLDTTGSFLLLLPDNTILQCANSVGQIISCAPQTQWTFSITLSPGMAPPLGNGPQTCSATLTISGASQSVSPSFSSCPSISKLVTGTTGPGGGGGGGGGGAPPTQAGGSCLATAVSPGQVCAGPVPSSSGQNPTFETSFVNSTPSSTTLSVSGAPFVNASSALVYSINGVGAVATVTPPGFSVIENSTTFQLYTQTVASIATITPTITVGAAQSQFGNLFFLGGNVNATPVHTATSVGGTCPGANDQCAQITAPAPVSASNILVVVANFPAPSGLNVSATATIGDQLGNPYLKVSAGVTTVGANSGEVWIVQNPIAGTPVILIDGHENSGSINGCCKMYELSGATAYFLGATGPAGFRYLTAQDLAGAGITTGVQSFAHTVLGGNVTVTGSATNVLAVTLTVPSGCPCRADIRYSGWANFAGVTNEPDFDFWVSDGVNNMVPFVSGQSNASSGAVTAISASELSPVTYAPGTSVTFTLKGIVSSANAGTIQFVYTAAQPTGGSGANSFLDVAFVPSK